MRAKRLLPFISLFIFFSSLNVFAQNGVLVTYNGGTNYEMVERTDLRRYDNGKYKGLISREVRAFIVSGSDGVYDGNFYVMEQTLRDSRAVTASLHDSIPARFRINPEGELIMLEDNGYPTFRSFPSYPKTKIKEGDTWVSEGVHAVDPLNKGVVTKIPMLVEYTYDGTDTYNGEDVFVIYARWATRYGKLYVDPQGDSSLREVMGKHEAKIIVSKLTGYAIVINDNMDEYYVYADGNRIQLKGTVSLFTKYPPAVNRDGIIRALQRVALIDADPKDNGIASGSGNAAPGGSLPGIGGTQGASSRPSPSPSPTSSAKETASQKAIDVADTDAGLMLTIRNLQFKSDSAELLPGQTPLLDSIAQVLKEAGESMFLIEGHTASTGNPVGEQRLSEERAHTVATELVKRGISADRFICKGSGGRKPVADNSTPEGKALNRRVEVTILY